jgi:uncharacterized protein (TIGR00369 family)
MTPGAREAAFDQAPCNRLFGFELLESADGGARIRLPIRDEFLQEERRVHGGVITALADTCAVYALKPGLPPGTAMTSIELKINFLHPVVSAGEPLTAIARTVRRGARVGVCDVDVYQQDQLVAKGLFTYLFFERR